MKPKFEIDQTIWYEHWADSFMCWGPIKDTVANIAMTSGGIFYTTCKYGSIARKEDDLYDNEEDCKQACIATMQNNIKHIQEHIDALMK